MRATPATPPTTPPAIAPALLELPDSEPEPEPDVLEDVLDPLPESPVPTELSPDPVSSVAAAVKFWTEKRSFKPV